jgi:hypothetical protein
MKTVIALLALLIATSTQAEGFRMQHTYPAEYRNECGSCHDPYPPGLMNKGDWARVMRNLDRHYGTDASLDGKATGRIARWLEENAGQRATLSGDPPRFTGSSWFKRQHREVPADVWKDPKVKTPAYCSGCHLTASAGNFNENQIRLPGRDRRYEDD